MRYEDPYFAEFLTYWKGLAADKGGVPTRQQFSPTGIKKSLPHVFMVERHAGNNFKTRLTGSGLDFATHGEYHIGDDMADYTDRDRDAYAAYMDVMFSVPCAAWSERLFVAPSGTAFVGDTVSLPLMDEAKNMQLALGLVRVTAVKDKKNKVKKTGKAYSVLLSLEYFDMGYGMPDEAWVYSGGTRLE